MSVETSKRREAKCPKCDAWFEVAWQDDLPPGGFWWANGSGTCPGCDETVLVETECQYRERESEQ